jgi:uncharacterized membrane protein YfcA
MPNPHHRKKHKRFQPPPHKDQSRKSSGAKSIMAITGAVIGLMIAWFATEGNFVWIGIGLAAGVIIGYNIGRRMDSEKSK